MGALLTSPAPCSSKPRGEAMTRFVSKRAKTFNKNTKGVTMLEYGLIAALVAVVAIVGLTSLGTSLNTQFNHIAGYLNVPASK